MADLLAQYEEYLATEKHASQNTLSSYMRDLHQFAVYLDEFHPMPLPQVTQEVISGYVAWMGGKGKSAATITRSIASIKSLYTYLQMTGEVSANPAKGVAAVKVEHKFPEILTGKEVELFLDQPQCVDAKGYRDHAMLELLYATGIRVSELISLNEEDVSLSASFIRAQSKGKERIIPLYPAAVKALSHYMKEVRPQLLADPEETALFVNMNGERMSRPGILEDRQALSGDRRHLKGHHAAYAASLVCRAPARKRCGPALHSGDAGPRGHFLDADLHACRQKAPQGRLSEGASAGMKRKLEGRSLSGLFHAVISRCISDSCLI